MVPSRTRIVLVGAGRRARQTILPAIHACSDRVELVGVCTRSERELELLGGRFRTTTTSLEDIDLASVQTVVVAVGLSNVPHVVDLLARRGAPGLTLMLDTPGLAPSDLRAAKLFPSFANVLASEDNYALPLFVLARRLLDEGAIGGLRHAHLAHSGYRHHAIAALKQLTGAAHPTRVAVHRWSSFSAELRIRFPGGVRATIVEPRRYGSGRTMIVGDGGFIVDYAIDHPKAIQVGYRTEGPRYLGLSVDGEPVEETELDRAFVSRLSDVPLEDPSLMNQMKIRGFMELLGGLGDPGSRFRYPALDAIADDLTVRFAERMPFATPGRPSLVRTAGRLAAPFVRSSGDEG